MDASQQLRLRFWGVRGSYPTPGPDTVHYGGNTPCIEVQLGPQTLIFDAGTGIIGLGQQLMREHRTQHVILIFSHFHPDHIQGLPFFTPLYHAPAALSFIGPGIGLQPLDQVLWTTMHPPYFPVPFPSVTCQAQSYTVRAPMTFTIPAMPPASPYPLPHALGHQPDGAGAMLTIHAQPSAAHSDHTVLYRLCWGGWTIVYATDVEGDAATNPHIAAFAQGADVLIHDAQYTEARYHGHEPGHGATRGWGHSTHGMACHMAQTAQVGRLILFHHDPSDTDATLDARERAAQALFPPSQVAYEGLELTFAARPGRDSPRR